MWLALTWPAGLKSGLPAPLATGRTENADCKQVDPKEAQHTCHLIQTDLAGTAAGAKYSEGIWILAASSH